MADETQDFDTVTIPELDNLTIALTSYFATSNLNGKLGKATVADFVTFIAPYIQGVAASGFVPITGTVLPASPAGSFSIVGAGTFTQAIGGNVVTTAMFNLIGNGNGTTWSLIKAIDTSAFVSKIDYNYGGVYATVAAANTAITNAVGTNGKNNRDAKIVDIGASGSYVKYWWRGGFANENLVPVVDLSQVAIAGLTPTLTKNLFDKRQISYVGDFWTSSLFKALPSTQYSVSSINKIFQYDKNLNLIPAATITKSPQSQTTFTTDANTAYFQFYDYRASENILQVELGATSTSYVAYKAIFDKNFYKPDLTDTDLTALLAPYSQTTLDFNKQKFTLTKVFPGNLLNPSPPFNGAGYVISGGAISNPADPNWFVTDYIEWGTNTQITTKFSRVGQYNAAKQFISGSYLGQSEGLGTVTKATGGVYVAFMMSAPLVSTYMVVFGATYPSTYTPYTPPYTNITTLSNGDPVYFNPIVVANSFQNNYWRGKNWLAIGDSVTAAGGAYIYETATKLGLNLSTHTLGGMGITQLVDGNPAPSFLAPLTLADVTGKDLITFFGGLNNRGLAEGVIGDLYPTQNTLIGMWQYALNQIYVLLKQANNLKCKIVFIAPYAAGSYSYISSNAYQDWPANSGMNIKTMADKEKAFCSYNAIPCVDLFSLSGINSNTWNYYMISNTPTNTDNSGPGPYKQYNDQLHPGANGHKRIAEVLTGFLQTIPVF